MVHLNSPASIRVLYMGPKRDISKYKHHPIGARREDLFQLNVSPPVFQAQTTLLLTWRSKSLFSTSENIPSVRVTVDLAYQDPGTLRLSTFWKVGGGRTRGKTFWARSKVNQDHFLLL